MIMASDCEINVLTAIFGDMINYFGKILYVEQMKALLMVQ